MWGMIRLLATSLLSKGGAAALAILVAATMGFWVYLDHLNARLEAAENLAKAQHEAVERLNNNLTSVIQSIDRLKELERTRSKALQDTKKAINSVPKTTYCIDSPATRAFLERMQ